VLLFLQSLSALSSYEPNLKRFGTSGVLKWIASLIDHFMDVDSVICGCCKALVPLDLHHTRLTALRHPSAPLQGDLAIDQESSERLGSLRVAELLISILGGYRKSELISSWACRAIARSPHPNSYMA